MQSTIRFKCYKCGAMIRVADKFAGRFVTCPKCQQRTGVPDSQAEADAEGRNYDVNLMAYDIPEKCIKCGKRMNRGAVICVHCGFNYKEGKQLKVEDHTVKPGEKTRGGPALQAMIVELLVMIGCAVAFFVRKGALEPVWWELGLYLGAIIAMIACFPAHFMQWNAYRHLPLRDHALKLEEDRAERVEAREPYGRKTAPVFLLAVALGVGFGYVQWGQQEEGSPQIVAAPPAPQP